MPTLTPQPATPRKPLLGLTLDELKSAVVSLGLPAFTARQMADWLYQKRVADISQMTNVSLAARRLLAEHYVVGRMAPAECQRSADGTAKYLFPTLRGHYVESVLIPDRDRATLCVSSQAGCKMGCTFCMTGRQGFAAQLDAADILNQIYSLPEHEQLTNVVFMGQGEPMDNVDAVLRATQALTAPWGLAWSPRRITVSTVGVIPAMERFIAESECHLAISLHHPEHEGRLALMPAEKAWPIADVVDRLRSYDVFRRGRVSAEQSKQRRLSFEYIPFAGINDTQHHARAICELLRGLDCRVNLIRFHNIPETPLRATSEQRLVQLRDYLTQHGVFTTIRASRGEDIWAACGQLSTARQEQERKRAAASAAEAPKSPTL